METIWTHTDAAQDQFDLDRRTAPGPHGEWVAWALPDGADGEAVGVWLDRAALLSLYRAIGDELRATGLATSPE